MTTNGETTVSAAEAVRQARALLTAEEQPPPLSAWGMQPAALEAARAWALLGIAEGMVELGRKIDQLTAELGRQGPL